MNPKQNSQHLGLMAGNSGSSQINLNPLSAEEVILLQKLIYGNPHYDPAQLLSHMLNSGNDNINEFRQQISLSNYDTWQVVRSNQVNLDQVKKELL